jgi:3-carboxy-cis,cis-muconate cycloisomerase
VTERATIDPGFSTPEMAAVFSDAATVAALLRFEEALALALADTAVAPAAEAAAVASACAVPVDHAGAIIDAAWEDGTPLLSLLAQVGERVVGGEARRWLHHGATTQDAVDTARVLQYRDALDSLDATSLRIAAELRGLTTTHLDTLQMGRTFLQAAKPTTFGRRAAKWLDAVLDGIEEMRRVRARLPAQLGGPVGDLTGYGDRGADVVDALARRLGLVAPSISWHTNRSPVLAVVGAVQLATHALAKVAGDIVVLSSSDVGEVSVRAGGSSAMPEKRNPIDAIRAIAAAEVSTGAAAMVGSGHRHELDRGAGGWHVEWLAMPLLFHTAAATAAGVERCLTTLAVDSDRMAGQVAAEDAAAILASDRRPVEAVLARHAAIIALS